MLSAAVIHVTEVVDSLLSPFVLRGESDSGTNIPISRRTTSTSSENAILLATLFLASLLDSRSRSLGPR
jgi:hypothetical protein